MSESGSSFGPLLRTLLHPMQVRSLLSSPAAPLLALPLPRSLARSALARSVRLSAKALITGCQDFFAFGKNFNLSPLFSGSF